VQSRTIIAGAERNLARRSPKRSPKAKGGKSGKSSSKGSKSSGKSSSKSGGGAGARQAQPRTPVKEIEGRATAIAQNGGLSKNSTQQWLQEEVRCCRCCSCLCSWPCFWSCFWSCFCLFPAADAQVTGAAAAPAAARDRHRVRA